MSSINIYKDSSNNSQDNFLSWGLNLRNPLIATGVLYLFLSMVMLVLIQIDNAEILGVNRWVKPFKFMVSGFVFNWTITYILTFFEWKPKNKKVFEWVLAMSMLLELSIIVLQPLRMQTSHYNNGTPIDGILFAFMGIFVSIISLQTICIWLLSYSKKFKANKAQKAAVRWGLGLMVLSFVGGSAMIGMSQHTIGAADGGAGLPMLNWSVEAGDLRVMHFVGMHAIQLLLLLVLLVGNKRNLVIIGGICLLALTSFVTYQALAEQPLLVV